MGKDEFINNLIDILLKVREKITDDSDVVWTRFDTPEQIRSIIDESIERLEKGNIESYGQLSNLFGPTGTFQEHSISNGWGREFLEIAARFDKLVGV